MSQRKKLFVEPSVKFTLKFKLNKVDELCKFNGFKIQISHWCRGMSKGLFVEEFIPFHYDDRANFAMKIN